MHNDDLLNDYYLILRTCSVRDLYLCFKQKQKSDARVIQSERKKRSNPRKEKEGNIRNSSYYDENGMGYVEAH